MSARLPLLHKTPFVLDERPLHEATSPHAGLLSVSRAYRSLAKQTPGENGGRDRGRTCKDYSKGS